MQCESVRPAIRRFLDDLLDEKDYQEIQEHLAACTRCHAYASSVGTLSYRLYELGQVSLPPDMLFTILYEWKKVPRKEAADVTIKEPNTGPKTAQASPAEAFTSRTRLFWVAAAVVCVASLVVIAGVALQRTLPQPVAPPPAAPVAVPAPPPAQPMSQVPASHVERHYHISRSSRSEVEELIRSLQLTVVQESARMLIFDVPQQAFGQLQKHLEVLSGVVKEYGEADPSEGAWATVRVSVYFE